MMKYSKIIILSLMALMIFVSNTSIVQAQFTGHGCAELVCNPAPGLFSTSFCKDDAKCEFADILSSVIQLFLGLCGLIALGYIILGGYELITAQGNDKSVESGKKTLTNAIIGLVIIILSYVIVSIVINAAFGRVDVTGILLPLIPKSIVVNPVSKLI
jgi:hypothetical protein